MIEKDRLEEYEPDDRGDGPFIMHPTGLWDELENYDRCIGFRVQDKGHKFVTYSDEVVKDYQYHRGLYDHVDCLDYGYVLYRSNNVPKTIDGDMERVNQAVLVSIGRLYCDW